MKFEKMSTSSKQYVVLDVETNGISSKEYDLLSITFYRPDNNLVYNRFLPLELNDGVYTTHINGIRKKDLKGMEPLQQEEVDLWFKNLELDRRIILHYGNLDQRFIKAYFKRHKLSGFDRMNFFNFKQLICTPSFSSGSFTKDNLCNMFGIEGVTDVHTGENDCRLEWELFKKIGGQPLLATEGWRGTNFFVLNEEYIIPASYLKSHPNLGKKVERPYIKVTDVNEVYKHRVKDEGIKRFATNFNGLVLENIINIMVEASRVDNETFLFENKGKMKMIGTMAYTDKPVPIILNDDGTVTAEEPYHRELEVSINEVVKVIMAGISPLIEYIKNDIFKGQRILSQELSIDKERGIMALCDLSNKEAILEIKTGEYDIEKFKEQLFYEAAGREIYILGLKWNFRTPKGRLISDDYPWWYADEYDVDSVDFFINKVMLEIGEKPDGRKARSEKALYSLMECAKEKGIEIIEYKSSTLPVLVKCSACGLEWSVRPETIKKGKPKCKSCNPKAPQSRSKREYVKMTPEEKVLRQKNRIKMYAEKFAEKVNILSDGYLQVDVDTYTGSKEKVAVKCKQCNYSKTIRADHLLARCWCSKCKSPN